MLRLMRTIYLVERKNLKFKSIFFVALLFIVGSFIYLENSQFRELEPITAAENMAKNSALDQFRNIDATDPVIASPLYRNLIAQSTEIANRTLGLAMEDDALYIKSMINLTEIREEVYTMDGFNEVSQFIPTPRQNQLDQALFTAIEAQDKPLLVKNSNFPTYILLLISVLGFSCYLLVGILSSDILQEEENHKSIVKGYPYTMATRLSAKILCYLIFVIALLISIFAITITIAAIKYDVDLTYPVAIFNGDFVTIAIWQYIGLAFVYFIVLSLTALFFSILLNYYFINIYIALFVHFFFFFIMQLTPVAAGRLWFLPFSYLNFSSLINGQAAEMTGNQMIHLTTGCFVLGITIFIIFLFIYWRFYLGQMKHTRGERA